MNTDNSFSWKPTIVMSIACSALIGFLLLLFTPISALGIQSTINVVLLAILGFCPALFFLSAAEQAREKHWRKFGIYILIGIAIILAITTAYIAIVVYFGIWAVTILAVVLLLTTAFCGLMALGGQLS